ncbi:MAG: flagellar L-ring protein FlgH [Bryobacterales bacterium]|jgi:flagellar L-ring protein precursor FlgH|nr:flagellar L-ring protein FlgH [Bryobacterales bacterium]
MKWRLSVGLGLICAAAHGGGIPNLKKKTKPPEPSLLEQYIRSASASAGAVETTPGAIWSPTARLTDLGRDLRASQMDDLVTVLVTESVNAVASGASTSQRASSANASVSSLAGKKSAAGALANLAGLSGDQKLNGVGTTSRAATLTATLTARVVRVLPGGLLLIEGDKSLQVNSEQQVITVRGIIRSTDISTGNTIPSAQIADMEVRVNGKGLVGDAVRRPNILYRLLLGVLPF